MTITPNIEIEARVITDILMEPDVIPDIRTQVHREMFTDPNLKTVVGVMKEHYAKYESVPSYSILKQHLFERAKNDIEHEFYDEIVDKIHETPTEGTDYTRELAFKFFKQQNIIKTANEILRIV